MDEAGSRRWRSAPVFASGHRPALQKAAKRKRMQLPAPSTCYNPYNSYKMNTPSRAIQASRGGIKTVEIVAFVGIAGALDIPARLLYTKHRKGAAGQTVVPLVRSKK